MKVLVTGGAGYIGSHTAVELIRAGHSVAAGVLPELTIFGGDYPTPDGTCQRDYLHVVGPRRDGDLPAFWADATKAKKLLGWEAAHTVEDMCRSAGDFAKRAAEDRGKN